ncbi:FkbM family methyltransferase [Butyrivibrio sp. TB]|uniref:FkbM family methyltransferase n=1 Tax=Butyrivibrio sp. TB TaxID=1520809 RepID=UPI0008C51A4E|nr:FkbM family methyltransferase [Butyrivibrio sp. TB]SEP94785.1 methyltransferase, FkbM family [Butyrivibrio sp. TB]
MFFRGVHVVADKMFGKMKWYGEFFRKRQERKECKESTGFFDKNQEVIAKNMAQLYDEESKKIYSGMIKYRMTRKDEDFPGCDDDQYFPKVVKDAFTNDMTFIDCGGFDGDTTTEFIKLVNGEYVGIVVFEPDEGLQERLHRNLESFHDVVINQKGVWDKDATLEFDMLSNGSSTVVENSGKMNSKTIKIAVTSIDQCPECKDASFIKMDLEGSEWKALHGAENTIKRNHPILAVCIYHSNEDFVRIQPYLHELVPEYHFFVRQYAYNNTSETVLYAIP